MKVGDEIYYTGDAANFPGYGKVVRVHGRSFDVRLDDGREFKALPLDAVRPVPGRRFVPIDERKKEIDEAYKKYYVK